MELKVISFNIRCRDDNDGHAIHERAPRLASLRMSHGNPKRAKLRGISSRGSQRYARVAQDACIR